MSTSHQQYCSRAPRSATAVTACSEEPLDLYASLVPSRLELLVTGINGFVGDTLRRKRSPWDVRMGFYHRNRRLALTPGSLARLCPQPGSRIAVFVHGLGAHEQLWAFPAEPGGSGRRVSYGSLLLQDYGITPLYLRYNSGLRISQNGQALSSLLQELVEAYPAPVEEIILVGHSLGGLLVRSACHHADEAGEEWVAKVGGAVYLGTPHFGTPWENSGTDRLIQWLAQSEHPAARQFIRFYEARAAAVRDLRYPHLVEEDWRPGSPPQPTRIPWGSRFAHYFVSGVLAGHAGHPLARLLGDGMVPLYSAQGIARDNLQTAEYAHIERFSAVIPRVGHLRLAHTPGVYQALKAWLGDRQVPGRQIAWRDTRFPEGESTWQTTNTKSPT